MNTLSRHHLGWLLALALILPLWSLPSVRASEERLRDEFIKAYWDIDSTRRLKALDLMSASGVVEDATKWTLYTVSHWDKDENVRRKAFHILSRTKDKDGYVAYLLSLSFNLEQDIDLKLRKAEMMRELDFKWHPLFELSAFLSGERYPRDGWVHGWSHHHYGWGGWHGPRFASFGRRGVPFGRGLGYGGGFGLGGAGFSVDHLTVRQERARLKRYLDVMNAMGDADFTVRQRFDEEVENWWKYKNEEYKVRDERLRAEKRAAADKPRMEPKAKQEAPAEKPKMSALLEYENHPVKKKEPDAKDAEKYVDEEEDIAE